MGDLMDIKLAKKLLNGIAYSQGRNLVSGRSVKQVTINEQDLINIYNQQNGKCYWSGLPLDQSFNKIKHHPFAISPERLDNSKPYDMTNVVLCRRMFNLGRMAFPEKDFEEAMKILKEEFKQG
jgi:hypothetical protein